MAAGSFLAHYGSIHFVSPFCSLHWVATHFNTRITRNIATLSCDYVRCRSLTLLLLAIDGRATETVLWWYSVVLQHFVALCNGSLIVDSIVLGQHEPTDKAVKFIQPVSNSWFFLSDLNVTPAFSSMDLKNLKQYCDSPACTHCSRMIFIRWFDKSADMDLKMLNMVIYFATTHLTTTLNYQDQKYK